MVILVIKSLYFFLPAYVANMAPVLFAWLPVLGISVNKKKFGVNKTWRGLIVAVIFGSAIYYIQKMLYLQGGIWQDLSVVDYAGHGLALGILLSFGAILGDLVESYYKRKRGIEPGEPWVPWDQLDFVIGGLLLSFLVYLPGIEVILLIVLLSPLLHLVVNYLGFMLKINKAKL